MAAKHITKITLTNFNPKNHNEKLQKDGRVELGRLMGIASKIKVAKAPDGVQTFEGLAGNFAAFIGDEEIRSGVLFMPDAFIEPLIQALRDEVDDDGEVVREGADSIQIAYSVAIYKADNPAGYSWELTPIIEVETNADPLAALIGQANKALAIEDKSKK